METKYVAFEYRDATIFGNFDPNATALDFGADISEKRMFLALPPVGQGTSAHQRIGNTIQPIRCKVTAQYFFTRNPQAPTQDDAQTNKNQLVEIRQLSFTPKSVKRWGDWINATGNTDHGYKRILPSLLEVGDGTLVPANSSNPLNFEYPLTNELVTPIKGNKRFIMGKNVGVIGAEGVSTLANIRAQNTLHWDVKLPKVLKYPETATSTFPDNACPLFGAYAGMIQNQSAATYDALQKPYLPPSSSLPQHPIIQMCYRIELWYKDS